MNLQVPFHYLFYTSSQSNLCDSNHENVSERRTTLQLNEWKTNDLKSTDQYLISSQSPVASIHYEHARPDFTASQSLSVADLLWTLTPLSHSLLIRHDFTCSVRFLPQTSFVSHAFWTAGAASQTITVLPQLSRLQSILPSLQSAFNASVPRCSLSRTRFFFTNLHHPTLASLVILPSLLLLSTSCSLLPADFPCWRMAHFPFRRSEKGK